MYAWTENFILPISHDEVVHGKHSLLDKMPGDEWQKRANYRLFMSYMTAHPGKKLMFMGSEFGQWHEWREHEQLDWPLLANPKHRGLQDLNRELAKLYRDTPQFHASDCDAGGFRWSDLHNADESVFAFLRQEHGHAPIVCVFNATPVPRDDYWLGVPDPGRYEVMFDSDHPGFGGSGFAGVGAYDAFEHDRARLSVCAARAVAAAGRRCSSSGRWMKDGSPDILGATFTGEGVNFAIRSRAATRVDVCLYDASGERETARLTLPGTHRARCTTASSSRSWRASARCTASACMAPTIRARAIASTPTNYCSIPGRATSSATSKWHPTHPRVTTANDPEGLRPEPHRQRAAMPRCRVIDGEFDWDGDRQPAVPWRDTLDLRAARQGIHAAASGRAAGMARQIPRAHRARGARPSEVAGRDGGRAHAGARLHDEGFLHERGLTNYWGYNTMGWFAPTSRYAVKDPVVELKQAVKALHAAGIEVILDVVYNHTAEGNELGPTLNFKAIDNRAYYFHRANDRRFYDDVTGCGNTVACDHPDRAGRHPGVAALLRRGIPHRRLPLRPRHRARPRPLGLQLELAVLRDAARGSGARLRETHRRALGRGPRRLPARQFSARLVASGTTAIATPCARSGMAAAAWSAASPNASRARRTCSAAMAASPPPASTSSPRMMASRCATPCRTTSGTTRPTSRTTATATRNNHSWNCGVEGPTDDVHVIALRRRQVRNMLTTLFFSQGVPMLLAGDELYRTQNGNNNAYCQDNEISWVNWTGLKDDDSLLQFVRGLVERCAARTRSCAATPFSRARCTPAIRATSRWWHPAGHEMADQEWNNPDLRCLAVGLGGTAVVAAI